MAVYAKIIPALGTVVVRVSLWSALAVSSSCMDGRHAPQTTRPKHGATLPGGVRGLSALARGERLTALQQGMSEQHVLMLLGKPDEERSVYAPPLLNPVYKGRRFLYEVERVTDRGVEKGCLDIYFDTQRRVVRFFVDERGTAD